LFHLFIHIFFGLQILLDTHNGYHPKKKSQLHDDPLGSSTDDLECIPALGRLSTVANWARVR
jgi:hypothetical protein